MKDKDKIKEQFSRVKHISLSFLKTSSLVGNKWNHRLSRWFFPITGLLALIWFLIRVIPKPSRATYPCQRVSFPLASSFLVWLIGVMCSAVFFRKAKYHFLRSRYLVGAICIAVSFGAAFIAISGGNKNKVLADDPIPNDPLGIAQGIHPGRVIWAHDPDATDWDGPGTGDGHWWEGNNTDIAVVDQMMFRSIRALTGENDITEAWDEIFRYFNQIHGKGNIGYQGGEKITIKVNLVGCIGVWGGDGVDPVTYDLVSRMDYMNTSPQMMLSLLRQLVYEVGVNQADISIGDTLCYFPNQYYDICHDEFPDVRYLDYEGKFGRTAVQQSSFPLYWSSHPSVSYQDYVPVSYAEADYIINLANFKSHSSASVTFCGKNHYGSLVRWPGQSGYYDLHGDLPYVRDGMGHYRNLVDLMGHAHIGGKTLLYLIDGLYAGLHPVDDAPTKLSSTPFNGDWSSSLFVSQDPVAIDSVVFDVLWADPVWSIYTHMSGGDDYLHEAALANNPPSGTFYDPDHSSDVTRLSSLGVHEHWNNPTDKQYSRNLGIGDGIELIHISSDMDNDGIPEDGDNNGIPGDNPCAGGATEDCDDNCPNDYNPLQEDTYPSQGNGIGDACDCECDFDCDGDVDADDVETFLVDFGRFELNNPCANDNQCHGDCECDTDVDAEDVEKFLADFGRFEFNNPCPACVVGNWCVYP